MPSLRRANFNALWIAIALVLIAIALAGCSTPSARATSLPPLVNYSKQFQKELLAEQPKVRACCPRAETVIKDYGKLRDMIRAGKAKQK
jgi:hypothetical protein